VCKYVLSIYVCVCMYERMYLCNVPCTCTNHSVSQLKGLVTVFSLQVPGFDPTAVYVEFLIQKVTLVKFTFLSTNGRWAEGQSEALVAADTVPPRPEQKKIQIFMYVCMFVRMYGCVCVCMYVCMYVCVCVCVCV
jgi:hypothetical protein